MPPGKRYEPQPQSESQNNQRNCCCGLEGSEHASELIIGLAILQHHAPIGFGQHSRAFFAGSAERKSNCSDRSTRTGNAAQDHSRVFFRLYLPLRDRPSLLNRKAMTEEMVTDKS